VAALLGAGNNARVKRNVSRRTDIYL